MRHETVVEYVAKRASVIPLRFGTIYLERNGIEQMLTEKSRELEEIIEHLRGREEWGVNVYCDRAVLMSSITSVSPVLREMVERAQQGVTRTVVLNAEEDRCAAMSTKRARR